MSRKESLGSCGRAVLADERPAAWNWWTSFMQEYSVGALFLRSLQSLNFSKLGRGVVAYGFTPYTGKIEAEGQR